MVYTTRCQWPFHVRSINVLSCFITLSLFNLTYGDYTKTVTSYLKRQRRSFEWIKLLTYNKTIVSEHGNFYTVWLNTRMLLRAKSTRRELTFSARTIIQIVPQYIQEYKAHTSKTNITCWPLWHAMWHLEACTSTHNIMLSKKLDTELYKQFNKFHLLYIVNVWYCYGNCII